MAPYLFINYRKKDTVALADSLYLMLQDALGDVIFKDNSILEKGHDFEPPIKQALEKATCMLVLIGEHWCQRRRDYVPAWRSKSIPAEPVLEGRGGVNCKGVTARQGRLRIGCCAAFGAACSA